MHVTLLYVICAVSTVITVYVRLMTLSRRYYTPLGYIRGSSGVRRPLYIGGRSEKDLIDEEEE